MGHEKLAEFMASLPEPFNCKGGYQDTLLTKLIRSEIALAVERDVLPAGTKVSVRKDHYRSFIVDIVEWSGAVFTSAYTDHLMDPATREKAFEGPTEWLTDDDERISRTHETLAKPLRHALVTVEQIANRHNYNNSRIEHDHFDVGYYLSVSASTVEGTARQGIQTESDPAYAKLLADAAKASRALGKACTESVCGRRGFEAASRWALERLVRMADKAKGRPVTYDKRRRAWVPCCDPSAGKACADHATWSAIESAVSSDASKRAHTERQAIPVSKVPAHIAASLTVNQSTPVLDPTRLYIGDNGRIHCGGRCAGMSAQYTGRAIDGHPVVLVTPERAKHFEDVTGELPSCEGCGMQPPDLYPSARRVTPQCAASMGCLCAGHARGDSADAPCDTRETVATTCEHKRTIDGGRCYVKPTRFCTDCGVAIISEAA